MKDLDKLECEYNEFEKIYNDKFQKLFGRIQREHRTARKEHRAVNQDIYQELYNTMEDWTNKDFELADQILNYWEPSKNTVN